MDNQALDDQKSALNKLVLRGPVLLGLIVIATFFGTFGVWASLAPIQSAAIAPGIVSVDTQRKTVQHLEGGIVGKILVTEGQKVAAGDVLFEMDKTRPHADLEVARLRHQAAVALEARLLSERDGEGDIQFPEDFGKNLDDDKAKELRDAQDNLFQARRKSMRGQIAILNQQIAQYLSEAKGVKEQINAQNEQTSLLKDETESQQKLFDQKLTGKARLLELQRDIVELRGQRSKNKANVSKIGQNITEAKLQIADLKARHLNEVLQELRDTQAEIRDLAEKIAALEDVLKRTEIRAPISGVIVELQVHTVGGVIAPGAPLVDIVPKDERLIIEANVDPTDIDVVTAGLEAEVRFTAFSQRNTQPTAAKVLTVSADHLMDERSGASYFLARVELDQASLDSLEGKEISPGMPVEVMIVTGERTPLEYFLQPLADSFNRALRES